MSKDVRCAADGGCATEALCYLAETTIVADKEGRWTIASG